MRTDLLSHLFAKLRFDPRGGIDADTGFASRRCIDTDAAGLAVMTDDCASFVVLAFEGAIPLGFAADLCSILRPAEQPYRMGAAEVGVLMPGITLRRAVGFAEHVRKMTEVELNAPARLTIGIATTAICGFDLAALATAAEAAARGARGRGGNRIAVARPGTFAPPARTAAA